MTLYDPPKMLRCRKNINKLDLAFDKGQAQRLVLVLD